MGRSIIHFPYYLRHLATRSLLNACRAHLNGFRMLGRLQRGWEWSHVRAPMQVYSRICDISCNRPLMMADGTVDPGYNLWIVTEIFNDVSYRGRSCSVCWHLSILLVGSQLRIALFNVIGHQKTSTRIALSRRGWAPSLRGCCHWQPGSYVNNASFVFPDVLRGVPSRSPQRNLGSCGIGDGDMEALATCFQDVGQDSIITL